MYSPHAGLNIKTYICDTIKMRRKNVVGGAGSSKIESSSY